VRRIKGFGENIGQLSLGIDVSHLNISLFNVISHEVVSPIKVSHSLVEDCVFCYRDDTGVITHEGNSLKAHSKVSHGMYNPQNLGAAATYSAFVVGCATEDYFQEDQQTREYTKKMTSARSALSLNPITHKISIEKVNNIK
jgi:hypothetical protein